jgi:predicted nucleic acid-binding protein
MTFADLVRGDAVFVDANVLTYPAQPHPVWGPPCRDLLQRIENQELRGFTSLPVLMEVAHRMMTIEASARFGWPFAGIGNRLRTHPADVRKLGAFRTAVENLLQGNLQVLSATPALLVAGLALSQQLGLLTNDALTSAIMQANGLSKIASNDVDFDRVPGLTRYGPG